MIVHGHLLLGSNDPNTIPDPTGLRALDLRQFSMFPFGLRYFWTSLHFMFSFGLRDFRLRVSVTLDYMFHVSISPFTMFPSRALCFSISLSRTPQLPLDPTLLYFA